MKAARQQAIVDLLLNHTSLTTEALSEQLKVSKETIRRDLNELQTQGKILRNHGRAKYIHRQNQDSGDPFHIRLKSHYAHKADIAREALAWIEEGMVIALDLQGLFGNARADVEASGGNTFNGKGGANASNTFNGTLTVTVDQVLVNGNLHVVGEKQIAINQGTEFIRFSGVVNPRTISGSNTVPSTQVADARIEYVGNGYINEAQNMGWLQRFFLNLSPM